MLARGLIKILSSGVMPPKPVSITPVMIEKIAPTSDGLNYYHRITSLLQKMDEIHNDIRQQSLSGWLKVEDESAACRLPDCAESAPFFVGLSRFAGGNRQQRTGGGFGERH